MADIKERFLDIFLREWALYRKKGAEETVEHGDTAIMEVPFDADVKPGEIRVFADGGRPMVGLVLLRQSEDGWLVVPTSEFTVPATEQEILIGERIYQLWNAFTATDDFVVRSWLVETSLSDDMRHVAQSLAHVLAGDALPEDLSELVGLPILATDDPRLDYECTFAWHVQVRAAEPPVARRWVFACRRSLMGMAACFAILAGTVAVILRDEDAERPPVCVTDVPVVRERPIEVIKEPIPGNEKVETPPQPIDEPVVEPVFSNGLDDRLDNPYGNWLDDRFKNRIGDTVEPDIEPMDEPVAKPVVEKPVVVEKVPATSVEKPIVAEKVPGVPVEKPQPVIKTVVNERPDVSKRVEVKSAEAIEKPGDIGRVGVPSPVADGDGTPSQPEVAITSEADTVPNERKSAERSAAKSAGKARCMVCDDDDDDAVPSRIERGGGSQFASQRMDSARYDELKCSKSRGSVSERKSECCKPMTSAAKSCKLIAGGAKRSKPMGCIAIGSASLDDDDSWPSASETAKEMSNERESQTKSVDPASYALLRRNLTVHKRWPPQNTVKLETYVNYFTFAYPEPTGDLPVAVHCEMAACPWNKAHRLVRIGVQAARAASDASDAFSESVVKDVKLQLAPVSEEELAWRPLGSEGESRAYQNSHWGWKNIVNLCAGRSETVFYEIEPAERLMVKLRYKLPNASKVHKLDQLVVASEITRSEGPSQDFRFASAVAEFALLLRDSVHKGDASFDSLLVRARSAKGDDPDGRRTEFIRLVEAALRVERKRDSDDVDDDF